MDLAIFNIWPDLSFEIIKYTVIFYVPFFVLIVIFWIIIYFIVKILLNLYRYKTYQRLYLQIVSQIKKQYIEDLINLPSKAFIKQFISILEMLVLKNRYKNIDEILLHIWFSQEDTIEIKDFIYKEIWDEKLIQAKIKSKIDYLIKLVW